MSLYMTELNITPEIAKNLYTRLVRARLFYLKVAELFQEQEMKCPVHLSVGQEGAPAAVSAALHDDDYIVSTHRCHAHTVAKGASFKKLFAELYGRVDGCGRGKGGSMHFLAPEVGDLGASAIVGGSIPLALGAALSSKMKGLDRISVAYFGDGAIEQGVFHEVMNFASLHKLPLLVVVENNNLATVTTLEKRQANKDLWRHAEHYAMPGVRVDGNRPEKVYEVAHAAVLRARQGGGPTLIEATCYRWRGHVESKIDPKLGFRSVEDSETTEKNDAVKNYAEWALENKTLSQKEIDDIDSTLLSLFAKRFSLVAKIGKHKKDNNLPIQDKNREKIIIEGTYLLKSENIICAPSQTKKRNMKKSRIGLSLELISYLYGESDNVTPPRNAPISIDK